LSEGETSAAGDPIVELVEAERYEDALGVSFSASRAEATAAFIRLSGRYSTQDHVRIALNKARSAILSETDLQKGDRLCRLSNGAISELDAALKPEIWLASPEALGEALDIVSRWLAIRPEEALCFQIRGQILHRLGRPEEALAAFDRALAINPDDASTWYAKGMVSKIQGWNEKASAAFDRALAINPEDASSWYEAGAVLRNQGRMEEALAAYDRALAIGPDSTDVWCAKGVALRNLVV
jgi:tetratricopeptide (TPR) repeat protein